MGNKSFTKNIIRNNKWDNVVKLVTKMKNLYFMLNKRILYKEEESGLNIKKMIQLIIKKI